MDKLSSAHIYLRLNEGDSWENIPQDLVTDLAQLTKANSIEGNKKDNITIIYTPWSNLKKDGSMAAGQVSFKDPRKVKKVLVVQRENVIINRLNKTKVEKQPDLQQEREDHRRELRKQDQAAQQQRVSSSHQFRCETCQFNNMATEEGRGQDNEGEAGEEVAEGPRLRRPVHGREHGVLEQSEQGRELGGGFYVKERMNCPTEVIYNFVITS